MDNHSLVLSEILRRLPSVEDSKKLCGLQRKRSFTAATSTSPLSCMESTENVMGTSEEKDVKDVPYER